MMFFGMQGGLVVLWVANKALAYFLGSLGSLSVYGLVALAYFLSSLLWFGSLSVYGLRYAQNFGINSILFWLALSLRSDWPKPA